MLFTDISGERTIRALKKAGFEIVKQGKHISMARDPYIVTIPRHKRLNPYTLKTIIKKAGLTDEQFKALL